MNESQLKQPNAKLDSSFRNQERAMADQMLADDLKRARAIRTAALEAKNNRGGQRTYDGSTHDSTVGWSRQHQFNATTDTTAAASLSNRHNHNHTASIAANMSSALPPEFHQSQSIKYQFANNNTIAGDAMQTFSGTGVVSNAMVDENKMLRDRVNAKSSEVFELRRQVDKAMQQLREKDRVCSALQQDVKNKQREIDEHQRRLVESQTQIERLHDIMNRVREEDDELHRKHAAGENRMLKLESKVRQLEDALEEV